MVNSSVRPRKTLTSQKWLRRNDSTSVSALLKPDEDDDEDVCLKYINKDSRSEDSDDSDDSEPRRVILSLPRKPKGPHKIYKSFCPECYCKSFPVAPSMGRPRDSCCCRRNSEQSAKPRARSTSARVATIPIGGYTKRREHYEDISKDYFKNLKQRLDELERDLKQEEAEIEKKKEEYRQLQQRGCCQSAKTCCEPPKKAPETRNQRKLKVVKEFRKTHFFDCHSSSTSLDKPTNPERKCPQQPPPCTTTNYCLHKYNLNNNLKFEPKNPDQFGTSRCQHCQKSISEETLTNPPTSNSRSLIFAKSSLENLNLLPLDGEDIDGEAEKYEHLQDKMFLTTRNNEQLEVTLPHNFLNEVQKPHTLSMLQTRTFKNFKVPVPADSMALRFQKGMINKTFASKHRCK